MMLSNFDWYRFTTIDFLANTMALLLTSDPNQSENYLSNLHSCESWLVVTLYSSLTKETLFSSPAKGKTNQYKYLTE